jgi:hypothetical protein
MKHSSEVRCRVSPFPIPYSLRNRHGLEATGANFTGAYRFCEQGRGTRARSFLHFACFDPDRHDGSFCYPTNPNPNLPSDISQAERSRRAQLPVGCGGERVRRKLSSGQQQQQCQERKTTTPSSLLLRTLPEGVVRPRMATEEEQSYPAPTATMTSILLELRLLLPPPPPLSLD